MIGRRGCLPVTKGSPKLEIWSLGGWGFESEAIRRILGIGFGGLGLEGSSMKVERSCKGREV